MKKILLSLPALLVTTAVFADGTEMLGLPGIPIASGTGLYANGTGMNSQPGSIAVEVPPGATVKQVLLYWEGFMATPVLGDDTISVSNGGPAVSVTGTLIGGPTFFFSGAYASTFRADITNLGLVGAGNGSLTVSDLAYTNVSNGAGVLVIFDDGSSDAGIDVRDGSDLAFIGFSGPLQTTEPQTFIFAPSDSDRIGQLPLFFASVQGAVSGGNLRPSAIELTTDGPNGETTVLNNQLVSNNGDEWDTLPIAIKIPAGSSTLTVQALSVDNENTGLLPASLDWIAATLGIEAEEPPGVCGRMTGGGSVFRVDGARVTRGFQIHCDLREPNNLEVNWPGNRFHMTDLTAALCTDSPAVDQTPPKSAPFDTFIGAGEGKLNNKEGARIEFTFTDAGEPGTADTALIRVFDANGDLALDVPGYPGLAGFLEYGNLQTHKDNRCPE